MDVHTVTARSLEQEPCRKHLLRKLDYLGPAAAVVVWAALPFVTCWLPLVTCWLPLVTCWLPLVTCWLPFVTCRLPPLVTCWLPPLGLPPGGGGVSCLLALPLLTCWLPPLLQ